MADINFNNETPIKVNVPNEPSYKVSLSKEKALKTSVPNLNYIPAYKEYEKERQENELKRIANEEQREEYIDKLKTDVENGLYNGKEGPQGPPGPQGETDNNYQNATNKPSINGVELDGNLKTEDLLLLYEKLLSLPKINGITLIGDLSTEDLGIEAGSDIELITKLYPESIEEDLKDNQVYNGNAIHDLARLFGLEMQNVYAIMPVILPNFDIEYTYEDNEVYNANAIHQLLELFVYEITMIQEEVASYSERISALEEKVGG